MLCLHVTKALSKMASLKVMASLIEEKNLLIYVILNLELYDC